MVFLFIDLGMKDTRRIAFAGLYRFTEEEIDYYFGSSPLVSQVKKQELIIYAGMHRLSEESIDAFFFRSPTGNQIVFKKTCRTQFLKLPLTAQCASAKLFFSMLRKGLQKKSILSNELFLLKCIKPLSKSFRPWLTLGNLFRHLHVHIRRRKKLLSYYRRNLRRFLRRRNSRRQRFLRRRNSRRQRFLRRRNSRRQRFLRRRNLYFYKIPRVARHRKFAGIKVRRKLRRRRFLGLRGTRKLYRKKFISLNRRNRFRFSRKLFHGLSRGRKFRMRALSCKADRKRYIRFVYRSRVRSQLIRFLRHCAGWGTLSGRVKNVIYRHLKISRLVIPFSQYVNSRVVVLSKFLTARFLRFQALLRLRRIVFLYLLIVVKRYLTVHRSKHKLTRWELKRKRERRYVRWYRRKQKRKLVRKIEWLKKKRRRLHRKYHRLPYRAYRRKKKRKFFLRALKRKAFQLISRVNALTTFRMYRSLLYKRIFYKVLVAKRLVGVKVARRHQAKHKKLRWDTNWGYVKLRKTRHNLFVSIHNRKHTLLYHTSVWAIGLKNEKNRLSYDSLIFAARKIVARLRKLRFFKINIYVCSKLSFHTKIFINTFRKRKIKIIRIIDAIKVPHHTGLRPQKSRTQK